MSGLILEMNLSIGRYVNNQFVGFSPNATNATKLEIKMDGELKTRISKRRNSYGQVLDSVAIPKPPECSIEVDNVGDAEIIAMGVMGTSSAVSAVATATVTDSNFTVSALNMWLPIGYRNITGLTVKKADDSALNSSNYELYQFETGMIKFSGGVTVGDIVKLSFSHHEESHVAISGMTDSIIKTRLFGDGRNLVNGKNCTLDIWEVPFSSKAALDFMSGDFMKMPLTGTCNTPVGKSSPFEIKYYD